MDFGTVIAGLAALSFGSGQFINGAVSARTSGIAVARWNLCSATLIMGIVTAIAHPGVPSVDAFGWAVVAGLGGVLAAAALYRSLEYGELSAVIPLCTITGMIIPIAVGVLLLGEPATPFTIVGLAAAVGGIVLVTRSGTQRWTTRSSSTPAESTVSSATRTSTPTSARSLGALGLPLLAGVGVAVELVGINRFPSHDLITLLCAEFLVGALVLLVIRTPQRAPLRVHHKALVFCSGALTATGMTLFHTAADTIGLSLAGIIIGLYPAVPLLLAVIVLGERPNKTRMLGLLFSVIAVLIIGST